MRYRVRTLLIILAIGLVLLDLSIVGGSEIFAERVAVPGGMVTWGILVMFVWGVIPLALIATLIALAITQLTQRGPK